MLAEDDRDLGFSRAEVSLQRKKQSSFGMQSNVVIFRSSFGNRLLRLIDCLLRLLQAAFAHEIPGFERRTVLVGKKLLMSSEPFIISGALLIEIESLTFRKLARWIDFKRVFEFTLGQVLKSKVYVEVS
jgi:hypothetical protein